MSKPFVIRVPKSTTEAMDLRAQYWQEWHTAKDAGDKEEEDKAWIKVEATEAAAVNLFERAGSPRHVVHHGEAYKITYAGPCKGIWPVYARTTEEADENLRRYGLLPC